MKYIFSTTLLCLTGIGGIVFLEYQALVKGIDGVALSTATAAIGALLGYVFKSIVSLKKKEVK